MTKRIRVENADTSSFKVCLQVWGISSQPGAPDMLQEEIALNNPCDAAERMIHSGQYLIVKEQPA